MSTVSIPCSNENSGGGGVRNEEKESSERAVSAVLRSERSVSILLLVLLLWVDVVSHFHGRIVTSTTTGRLSFRILAISSGMAMHPWPTGSRWMNNRITLFRFVDNSD